MNQEEAIQVATELYNKSEAKYRISKSAAMHLKKGMFGGKGLRGWQVILILDSQIEPNEFVVEIYEPDDKVQVIEMI